jgi:hypothetical protein
LAAHRIGSAAHIAGYALADVMHDGVVVGAECVRFFLSFAATVSCTIG